MKLGLGLIAAAFCAAPLVAQAEEDPGADMSASVGDDTALVTTGASDLALAPLPPRLEDLPGTLLLGSTRASAEPGDSIGKYRLYTLKQGQLTQLHVPDESLGSSSAALSPDGKRLLLDAGGQAIYLVDLAGANPPQQLGDRLPPLAFGQTDTYLSVAWSQDGSHAIVVRPFPKGMSLVSLGDKSSAPMPLTAQLPSFSPDGKQLAVAYTAAGASRAAIYTAPLGQYDALTKVSSSSDYETDPQWLTDGSGLVYVAAGDRWEVRKAGAGSTSPNVLAQAPLGTVISDLAVSPDGAWVAYTLQTTADGHRSVHISSTTNASLGVDLPQDHPWNDRVFGWVAGS